MKVGEPFKDELLSQDGAVTLIGAGTVVTREMVQRLSNWITAEEPRAVIEREKKPVESTRDTILRKLEFDQIVSEKTRGELEKGVGDFFGRAGNKEKKLDIKGLEDAVAALVDETPDNPDVPLRLFELKQHAEIIYNHSIECGVMASFVATALGYPAHDVTSFSLSMMLHDVGYLSLPGDIMEMKRLPSLEETEQIRRHPRNGFDMLKRVPGIEPLALMTALGHHVSADGTGYPDGVDFHEMPSLVHLASLINDFESLISPRPTQRAINMHDAVKLILSRRDRYHPAAVENFVKVIGIFPISTFVTLNTGEAGVVVRNNPGNLFLPEVKLVQDPAGKLYSKEIIVNLSNEPVRKIMKVQERV